MHRVRASLAAGLMSGLAALSLGVVRAADGPSYADSVDRALALVRSAPSGDTSAASEAADVLEAGTVYTSFGSEPFTRASASPRWSRRFGTRPSRRSPERPTPPSTAS